MPPTITPGAIVGIRAAPGAAAQARATKTTSTTARCSIGGEWYARKLRKSTSAVRPRSYGGSPMQEGGWTIKPCVPDDVLALAGELGIGELTASVLVRRGYDTAERARAFLAAEPPRHDPFLLGDMAGAVEAIRKAIAEGKRICVHGDYDVDGICAPALALLSLRALGADVDWHLPSRFDEGYGLSGETLDRLADDGCGLVLTVDCGITAVDEVARAKSRGLDVVVTDHHRPAAELPGCP